MSKPLRILLIAAITAGLLVLFLRNSDPREVLDVLGRIHPLWFAAALLTNFSALVFRTLRWRTVLAASSGKVIPPYDTFLATAIGFMSSAVLPIRAGDLVRPALLSRRTSIRFSTALGTVVLERLVDLTAVLVMFLVFSLTGGRELSANPATARKALLIHSAASIAGLVLLTLAVLAVSFYFFHGAARRAHLWIGARLPRRVRGGWVAFFDSFSAAVQLVRSPGVLLRVVAFTCGIWLCLTGQFILVLHSIDRPLPYLSSFLVTGMTILGLSIPTPGGVGGFHKAAQMALTNFYGFRVSESVAVALAFHIVGTAPVVITGLWLFAREGLNLRQLAGMQEAAVEETQAIDDGDDSSPPPIDH